MLKRLIICLLTVFCLALCACAPQTPPPTTTPPEEFKPVGLTVKDNKLMKDGKEYSTIGVNYLGLFYDMLDGKSGMTEGLETLKSYGIECIRVPVNATHTESVFQKYFTDPDRWWSILAQIITKAEELDIGLICGFFWSETVIPNHFNENVSESFRDENSKSSKYMEEYISKFIEKFGDSKAVVGFEYGNEIMWAAQVPGANKEYNVDDVIAAYTRFTGVIKKYDKHNRFIGSGDAGLRNFSYNSYNYNSFDADTLAEQKEMANKICPMDGFSWHDYSNSVKAIDNPENFTVKREFFDENTGSKIELYKTWDEYFEFINDIAKASGKIPYLGETSFIHDDAKAMVTYEQTYSVMDTILKSATKNKIPLVFVWNYDPLSNLIENDFSGNGDGWAHSWNQKSDRGKAILDCIKNNNK